MNSLVIMRIATATAVLLLGASIASALPAYLPPGVGYGESYRLIFVTDWNTDSYSRNIDDYNAFVTSEALLSPDLAGLSTTWRAVFSTDTINALENIGTFGTPVYGLNGARVALGSQGLFSGSLESPIYQNQYAQGVFSQLVKTATYPNNGNLFYDSGLVGITNTTSREWLVFQTPQYPTWSDGTPLRMYAISGDILVAQPDEVTAVAIPEPGCFGLACLGLGCAAVGCMRHGASARRSRLARTSTSSE